MSKPSRVRLVVVMDPIAAIKPAKDSTLRILLAAQARGWELFYAELKDLWLRDGIAVNPKDICIQYRHDSGALTRVIDQLAERGLLERVRRDRDRRKVELQLTPAGLEAINGVIPHVVEKLNLALADFSGAEFAEFFRLLTKLNTTLQSAVNPATAPADA